MNGAPNRRVVTGVDDGGRSCVISDAPVAAHYEVASRGGLSVAAFFEVPIPVFTTQDGGDPDGALTMIPAPGVARVIRSFLPPDSAAVGAPPPVENEGSESRSQYFDPQRGPGMHATPTVDVMFVASGRIDLVLEAERVPLATGDVVVQRGTWHSWSNPYDDPCILVGVNFAVGDSSTPSV
ncbi:MAG: cupin domain-containing protein [Acidimicrobiales bacterium]